MLHMEVPDDALAYLSPCKLSGNLRDLFTPDVTAPTVTHSNPFQETNPDCLP